MPSASQRIALQACVGLCVLGNTLETMLEMSAGQARTLDCCEIFSGVGSIWNAAAAEGFNALGLDDQISVDMDVLTPIGLKQAVLMVASVRERGLVWIAPVCSTFCGLCSCQTKRSKLNPGGDSWSEAVHRGNMIAEIGILLWALAFARNCCPILENPLGNFFWSFQPVVRALANITAIKATCCRCHFIPGKKPKVKKPFCLAGPMDWMHKLNFACKCKVPHLKLADVVMKNGKKQINGKQSQLKESGAYPKKMGEAVVNVWKDAEQKQQKQVMKRPASSFNWQTELH